MSPSKESFAAAGGKILFTQPLSNFNLARSAKKDFQILYRTADREHPGPAKP